MNDEFFHMDHKGPSRILSPDVSLIESAFQYDTQKTLNNFFENLYHREQELVRPLEQSLDHTLNLLERTYDLVIKTLPLVQDNAIYIELAELMTDIEANLKFYEPERKKGADHGNRNP